MQTSVDLLGLAIGMRLACFARGVEGAGDLGFAEAGLAGGGGQWAEVGGGVGVQGAVGGPVQARVAVAFGLASEPAGQLTEPAVGGVVWSRVFLLPLGFHQSGDGEPVQGAAATGPAHEPVRLSADLGGRGHDVTAGATEVEVVAGQAAVVLVRAGEVGVHSAEVAVAGLAVLVDVQDVGAGVAGGDGQVPALAAAEPCGDLLLVGGGVLVAVGGGGDLLAGQAGKTGQPRRA
jgi:hypothetical protein